MSLRRVCVIHAISLNLLQVLRLIDDGFHAELGENADEEEAQTDENLQVHLGRFSILD